MSGVAGRSLPPELVAPSRWGAQTGFVQPRQPAFWMYLGLLVVGGFLFADEQLTMSRLPTAYGLSWALMLVYALPVAALIYWLDLFEREPRSLLIAALVWGGVIATAFAAPANTAWLSVLGKLDPETTRSWGAAIVGPGVEETLKLLGVVTIYLLARGEVDDVLDGFVYGAMIGLGFTVVEDVLYFMNAVAAAPGALDQTGPVIDTFIIRVVAGGPYTHVLFSGLTGMGFAYLVTRPAVPLRRRIAVSVAGVAAGVAAHVVWNSPWMVSILESTDGRPSPVQWIELATLKGLPFLTLLGGLVVVATRTESDSFGELVAGEVGDPASGASIAPAELVSLRSVLARRSARKRATRERGPAAGRLVGELQAAQVALGMALSQAGSREAPEVDLQRARIRDLRARIAALPAVAIVSTAPAAGPDGPSSLTPAWAPTHVVPAGGLPAWPAPDPALAPAATLPERLEVAIDGTAGDWALVRAVNGWRGWVDGRRLAAR